MCGRYVRSSPAEVVTAEFGITSSADLDLAPRYNICPGQVIAAVVQSGAERRLGPLRWGFGRGGRMTSPAPGPINVRSETAALRPTFREALRRRRCLIIADGFYEWRKESGRKTPYFIRLVSGRPFAFAGLWQRATVRGGIASAAILTCEPNQLLAKIHDRMPVVLTRDGCERWLDEGVEDPAALDPLLAPLPATELEAYPVSPLVNTARNDSPELLRPDLTPLSEKWGHS